jgi:AcrR family transcriptional regulator
VSDRAETRRRELVVAAYKVFVTKGYHGAGVADIVREAGVSHGTFYNYFDNKRHVLDDALDHVVEVIVDGVVGTDQPREVTSANELAEDFRAMLSRLFELVDEQPGLVQFTMFDAPAIDDRVIDRLLTLISTFGSLAGAYLESGVERGFLPSGLDTRIAGEGLLSLMMSSVLPTLRGPLTDAERGRHIDALVGFAFNGLAARPRSQ